MRSFPLRSVLSAVGCVALVACGGGDDGASSTDPSTGGAGGAAATSTGGVAGASGGANTAGKAGAAGLAGHAGNAGDGGKGGAAGGQSGSSGASGKSGAAGSQGGKGGASGGQSGTGGASGKGGAGTGGAGGGKAGAGGGQAGTGGSQAGAAGASAGGPGMGGSAGAPVGWKLVWSDEFDQPDGSPPDPKKWKAETGGDGWGNQEREYYTDKTENAVQQGGLLLVTARKLTGGNGLNCWYGECQYTSARLVSKGLYEKQYGRFAARIKLPSGQGMWPAFWLLGNDIGQAGWPACGELDTMENIGKEPSKVHGTVHVPGKQPGQGYGGPFTLASGTFADDFHVFAIEWSAQKVDFFVDDTKYFSVGPSGLGGDPWKFDHPFFMLLNLAIGGGWPGDPDSSTPFPATMSVDWVRVYDPG